MSFEICCDEIAARDRQSSTHQPATERRLNLCPTLALPLKLIDLAFADAVKCRNGRPTELAIIAAEWIADDTFGPGTFLWCFHWLSLNPADVRERGLARPKGGSWRGWGAAQGLPAVFERWEQARSQAPK
jgi:hypothetical protein